MSKSYKGKERDEWKKRAKDWKRIRNKRSIPEYDQDKQKSNHSWNDNN